jgi:hypothetical protein
MLDDYCAMTFLASARKAGARTRACTAGGLFSTGGASGFD